MHLPRLLVPAVLVPAAVALAGCAGPTTSTAPAGASPAATHVVASAVDACALVPTTELKAAIKADPGTGVPTTGRIDGGVCTWKVTDTHSAIAQFTRQPDLYLPSSVWKPSKSGASVPGTTRGFADASKHSILVVKDGKGLLFTDLAFDTADQDAYDALAKAIAAKL